MDTSPEPVPIGKDKLLGPRWVRIFRILLIVFLLAYVLHGPILKAAGEYLVHEDAPVKADLIVVLAGSPVVRAMAGADYYNRELAPTIYLSRGNLEGSSLVADLDLMDTGNWELAFRILTQKGVPPDAVIRDTAFVDSTLAEARRLKTFLRGRGIKTIILVTSQFHSRRAHLIFTRTIGPDLQVISLPSPYDPFQADNWWRNRGAAKRVVMEYQKLLYYFWETLGDED